MISAKGEGRRMLATVVSATGMIPFFNNVSDKSMPFKGQLIISIKHRNLMLHSTSRKLILNTFIYFLLTHISLVRPNIAAILSASRVH
ncbi:hypothetical protein XENTR_v10021438 [Xenopus tropicalis]|nr:hypothetical protein XENTR_v10021438 [Xenopus tropicalis]